jgi:hypothetical protein
MSTSDLPGADWRTSSYSGTGGNCVQVAANLPGLVAVRDSKNPSDGALAFSPGAWAEFLTGIRCGELGT